MLTIANPIYDTVFKYLMEDERIARTILSALLKEDIVRVEMRPHEYSNGQKEMMSIFRIDFGATIRKDDGQEQLVLIELQKSWLPTEILRFRQYLGVHYQNPKNIVGDSPDRHALPMVAVYLLGHDVGQIEEPVIYVRNQTLNYDNMPITRGLPNPFIESLSHNSIIVQIPRLHGKINNRLDKVLSIFDQTQVSQESQHYLRLDDAAYDAADSDMQPILHRLMKAALSVEMRQDMNVEDEYFSLIKEQEGKLYGLERDLEDTIRQLAEKKSLLAEKDGQLAEKDGQLAEKDGQLAEKDGQLAEKDGQLAEKDGQLAEKDGQLAEKDGQLAEKDGQLAEKDGQLRQLVGMLLKMGQTPESIAEQLHIDAESIKALGKSEP
ncbi:MAG: hypothetical protein K5928_02830 [Prevotella sp.]|nr:hypothetical protein [Prevotella sp.]